MTDKIGRFLKITPSSLGSEYINRRKAIGCLRLSKATKVAPPSGRGRDLFKPIAAEFYRCLFVYPMVEFTIQLLENNCYILQGNHGQNRKIKIRHC